MGLGYLLRLPFNYTTNLLFHETQCIFIDVLTIFPSFWKQPSPSPSTKTFGSTQLEFDKQKRSQRYEDKKNDNWQLDRGNPLSLQKESLKVQHYSSVPPNSSTPAQWCLLQPVAAETISWVGGHRRSTGHQGNSGSRSALGISCECRIDIYKKSGFLVSQGIFPGLCKIAILCLSQS